MTFNCSPQTKKWIDSSRLFKQFHRYEPVIEKAFACLWGERPEEASLPRKQQNWEEGDLKKYLSCRDISMSPMETRWHLINIRSLHSRALLYKVEVPQLFGLVLYMLNKMSSMYFDQLSYDIEEEASKIETNKQILLSSSKVKQDLCNHKWNTFKQYIWSYGDS